MSASLPVLSWRWLYTIACGLVIPQLVGGATALWEPNQEQVRVWYEGERHKRRYITKSRRIGISTALDLEDGVWTKWCDELGHRVRCGIVLHREKNLKERMVQIASFLNQLYGFGDVDEVDDATFSISFPNGSEVFGVTAGGDDAARSEGAQRMRYEEYAFYTKGIASIAPAVALNVTETICTTIDIGAPNGAKAREMWRSRNAYKKIFFPFERHHDYRMPRDSITDDEWEWAKGEGFTVREAAAFWRNEVLPNKCEGDVIKALREYPQKEGHMFQSSETRWVSITPEPTEPLFYGNRFDEDIWTVVGLRGDDWPIAVYRLPEDASDVIVCLDTSSAKNQSRSVAVAIDMKDGRVCAIVASDRLHFDDLVRVALVMQHAYAKPRSESGLAIIEEQGVGDSTVAEAQKMGLRYEVHTPTVDSKYQGMLAAKMAIESGRMFGYVVLIRDENDEVIGQRWVDHGERGVVAGTKEIAEECDEVHRDPKTGEFKGRKDIMMAYGMGALKMKRSPYVEPLDKKQRAERNYFNEALKQHKRQTAKRRGVV